MRPPISTCPAPLFPYTPRFRSKSCFPHSNRKRNRPPCKKSSKRSWTCCALPICFCVKSSGSALDTTRAPPLSGGSRWAIRASSINSKRAGLRDWIRPQRSRHTWRGKMQPRSSSRERRETALAEIGRCVLQDRNASYGDPEDNFQDIADRWTVLFRGRGVAFTPADVAAMMCDVKLARLRTSADKPDNWIDLAGYAVCGYSVTQRDDKPIADDPDTFVFKVRSEEHTSE